MTTTTPTPSILLANMSAKEIALTKIMRAPMQTTTTPAPRVVTLKSGGTITLYWSASLKTYVTIPE